MSIMKIELNTKDLALVNKISRNVDAGIIVTADIKALLSLIRGQPGGTKFDNRKTRTPKKQERKDRYRQKLIN
jgi:hypothetical protein